MSELFKTASKEKIRFDTARGLLTVEDLWDLPLTSGRGPSLDSVAQSLDTQIKASTTSFVTKATSKNASLELGFEIVKVIIADRIAVKEANVLRVAKEQQKTRIRQLLNNKQDEELASKTVEELEALLAD